MTHVQAQGRGEGAEDFWEGARRRDAYIETRGGKNGWGGGRGGGDLP